MTISFRDIFNKAKARFLAAAVRPEILPTRGVPMEKPSGERMSKTVLPNKVKSSPPGADPFRGGGALESGLRIIGQKRELPPAVALALQPKVERAISLELSDFLDQVPSGFMKSAETFDASRRILLKASEIEKGMATGKPTVSLAAVYEQAPEIFLHSLSTEDATEVSLPFQKVLEQFENVHVREDQERDQEVPQMETPILQVTLEDTERFGTAMEPLETSALPPVIVEPATASTIAKAEPEAVSRETTASAAVQPSAVSLKSAKGKKSKPSRASSSDGGAPTRIPFRLPPKGTGVPASERVPASSGPSVPNLPKTSPRIPFKISAPSDALRPKFRLVPGMEKETESAFETAGPAAKKDDLKVTLGLLSILQNVPGFQLSGSPETIPADVRVAFPLSMIEPQLASGRVAITPKTFQAAMPAQYRELFVVDATETPVLLPLQEVLTNLPETALKMRSDQEALETGETFETPFSIQAAEDAKRFNNPEAADQKSAESNATVEAAAASEKTETPSGTPEPAVPAPETGEKIEAKSEVTASPAETVAKTGKKSGTETEDKNEAKQVVEKASALPGVAGCSVTFADGLSLAGNLPADVAVDGLCAMAPSLLQRIDRHMLDTKLGPLTSMTLHCAKSPVTFFMKGNVCLTVLHAGGDLASETQNTLAEMAKELSRTYSEPETTHVDH